MCIYIFFLTPCLIYRVFFPAKLVPHVTEIRALSHGVRLDAHGSCPEIVSRVETRRDTWTCPNDDDDDDDGSGDLPLPVVCVESKENVKMCGMKVTRFLMLIGFQINFSGMIH